MKHTLIALALCALPAVSQAVVIDFEDLAGDTVVTSQYAAFATFSSETGAENVTMPFGANGNILCTRLVGGSVDCIHDTYVDFTGPVNGLQFDAIEPNFDGIDATFNIVHSGGTSTEFLTGLGGAGNKHVDLSAYTGVTRLEIVDILDDVSNENGIGWDNFSFEVVPEPTTMAALGIGLAAFHRRRKAR